MNDVLYDNIISQNCEGVPYYIVPFTYVIACSHSKELRSVNKVQSRDITAITISVRTENLTLCYTTQINKYVVKNMISQCIGGLYSFITYFRNTKGIPHLEISNRGKVRVM